MNLKNEELKEHNLIWLLKKRDLFFFLGIKFAQTSVFPCNFHLSILSYHLIQKHNRRCTETSAFN